MSLHKYCKWKLLRPSGFFETWKLPLCFDVHDVTSHASYSEIWLYIYRGQPVYIAGSGYVRGPCWAHWSEYAGEFDSTCEDPEQLSNDKLIALCQGKAGRCPTATGGKAGVRGPGGSLRR